MAKVLVTGATGFIGGHLAHWLAERGHQVCCLVRPTSNREALRSLNVELVEAPLLDSLAWAPAVRDVDWVFHLAGVTSAFHRRTMMEVNALGTANVARLCAEQSDPPVLILVSSIAAVGPSRRGHVKTEYEPARPISNYGRSKRAGEVAAAQFADRMPLTIVRPGIVFGEGGVDMLPMFRSIRRLRVHAVAGLRSPPLSVIHVRELVELLERAATDGQRIARTDCSGTGHHGYYFACRPENPDYFEFGRLLHQAIGNRYTSFLHFPETVAWLLGGVGEGIGRVRGKPFSLNIDKIREALAESWACSCHAAQRDLGYMPLQSLLEQLRQTANWYREQGWL
ncbi:MAG: NAD-dependent epimerase/dehydratase family protein [Pirellulaceae bacterium]